MRKLLLMLFAASAILSQAQNHRLALEQQPTSARSIAMGGTIIGHTGNTIHTHPALAAASAEPTTLSYSLATAHGISPRHGVHNLAFTQLVGQGALMAGVRYHDYGHLSGLLDANMQPTGQTLHLHNFQADLGYAHKLGAWFIGATLGLASEQTATQFNALAMGVSAAYQRQTANYTYTLGAGLKGWGIGYSQSKSTMLSPLLYAGGAVSADIAKSHTLSLSADAGVHPASEAGTRKALWSLGGEYKFMSRYALRLGHHWGEGTDYLGFGAGVSFGFATIELAMQLPTDDYLPTRFIAGFTAKF